MIGWWPPVGVIAMLVLGCAVGQRSTAIDDWFERYRRGPAHWLLFFTDPRVLTIVLAGCVGVALYRRHWRLAAMGVVSPLAAVALVELTKRIFGRQRDGALAYPSGHTTVAVVVLGLVIVVAGATLWALLVTIAFCLLAMIGQAVTYHYFTDTIGGLLLGTAVACVVARVAQADLTGVNPGAI